MSTSEAVDEEAPYGLERSQIIEALEPMMTDRRRGRVEEVLAARLGGLTVVLEGLYDDGNMSAVLRTCDALGVQRVNLALWEGQSFKSERRVSQGSHKWLDIHQYVGAGECVEALRAKGFQIVATHLSASVPLSEIDFTQKTALVFGNEKVGVSEEMASLADRHVHIPMYGFVQSFNISVAAAICLHHGAAQRRRHVGRDGDLDEAELEALRARFYRRAVKTSDLVLSEYEG